MKIKHNKIKNTGILFEILTRQITNEILNTKEEKVKSPAIAGIKEHFNPSSLILKEYVLYQKLLNTKFADKERANSFIDIVLSERKKLSEATLRKEKYNLIQFLNKNFDLKKLFEAPVPNYKMYGSIYKLFEYNTNNLTEQISNPEELVESRFNILSLIMQKNLTKNKSIKYLNEYYSHSKDIQLLSYKILVDKFNEKYTSKLNEDQKTIIREYIKNISNKEHLTEFLKSKITDIMKEMRVLYKASSNNNIKIKLKELYSQFKKVKTNKNISDNIVLGIMRTYELLSEIKQAQRIK